MRKHVSSSEIGERIKTIREKLNIPQKTMAEALQIAASYLSGIEKGNANPGPELFVRLASEYNVNMNYLFTGKGDMFGDAPLKISKQEVDINRGIDSIEELNWLMANSAYLRFSIIAEANKLLIVNNNLIKQSLQINIAKKDNLQTPPVPTTIHKKDEPRKEAHKKGKKKDTSKQAKKIIPAQDIRNKSQTKKP